MCTWRGKLYLVEIKGETLNLGGYVNWQFYLSVHRIYVQPVKRPKKILGNCFLQKIISSNKYPMSKLWNLCSKWLCPSGYHVTVFCIILCFLSTYVRQYFYSLNLLRTRKEETTYLLWFYTSLRLKGRRYNIKGIRAVYSTFHKFTIFFKTKQINKNMLLK